MPVTGVKMTPVYRLLRRVSKQHPSHLGGVKLTPVSLSLQTGVNLTPVTGVKTTPPRVST
ncbi:hypothetical protein BMS3Bbin13_00094 [bacterium BMS3Bbin13]|nr:hypothetical protein BMS3Bbin13_00094 [bacterium BMS3Bbin13]